MTGFKQAVSPSEHEFIAGYFVGMADHIDNAGGNGWIRSWIRVNAAECGGFVLFKPQRERFIFHMQQSFTRSLQGRPVTAYI